MTAYKSELKEPFIKEVGEYLDLVEQYFANDQNALVFKNGECTLSYLLENIKSVSEMIGINQPARAASLLLTYLDRRSLDLDYRIESLDRWSKPVRDALHEMLEEVGRNRLDRLDDVLSALESSLDMGVEKIYSNMPDEFSNELLEIFLKEARENYIGMEQSVMRLLDDPKNSLESNKLFGFLMNLKGGADMVNQHSVGIVTDMLSEILEALEKGKITINDDVIEFYARGMDTIEKILYRLQAGELNQDDLLNKFKKTTKNLIPIKLVQSEKENLPKSEAKKPVSELYTDKDFMLEMREIFKIEATEHLAQFAQYVLEAERNPKDKELVNKLFRVVHTLKGAAATVGLQDISDVAHELENLLDDWRGSNKIIDEGLISVLYEAQKGLGDIFENTYDDKNKIPELKNQVFQMLGHFKSSAMLPPKPTDNDSTPLESISTTNVQSDILSRRTVRVPINKLDNLINHVSELNTFKVRLDDAVKEAELYSKKIKWERVNLNKVINEFQRKYQWETPVPGLSIPRNDGFSELEFDRYSDIAIFARNIEELDFKIASVMKKVEHLMLELNEEGASFGTLVNTIKDEMIQIRMVKISRLFKIIEFESKRLARSLGKKINFITEGGDTEVDKSIIDNLADPMMHLLRNCIDHGIESPERRKELKKSVKGTIKIHAFQEEGKIILLVDDDGAGIQVDKILAKAIDSGVISKEWATSRSDDELQNLIFYPQVSTTEITSMISGRGVGMDAVRHAINEMYGSIQLSSKKDEGTRFWITLPTTLAVQPILEVQSSGSDFCLPMHYVEQIIEANKLQYVDDKRQEILFEDEQMPIRWLSGFLGQSGDEKTGYSPAIVLHTGDKRMALMVGGVHGSNESIIRPLSELLEICHVFIGTTITPRGVVKLVLNIPFLFEMNDNLSALVKPRFQPAALVKVLVADDSLSVRQTLKSMLTRHGLKVNTAKDGLVALQKMHGISPDMMIVDLEMPNLNGFELMERIRQDSKFSHIPILVLTSRGGARHHQLAMASGADAFLSKPATERDLIYKVRSLLPLALKELMDERDPQILG